MSGLPPEGELLMPGWSRYAQQPIDLSSRRSVRLVRPNAEQLDHEAKEVVFDYFYDGGEYWRAVAPLDSVNEIYGQAFNFSSVRTRTRDGKVEPVLDKHGAPKHRIPILNHVQVRFVLDPQDAIRLYPLGSDCAGEPHKLIHDFIYSLEAVGPPGVYFNLRDTLFGNLLAAHRLYSTEEMVFERLVLEDNHVSESPALPLDASVKRDLLLHSLLRSHHAGSSERYYLFRLFETNNCTSNAFSVLDSVADYTLRQRLGALLYRLPLSPRLYLRMRGLDSAPAIKKSVRAEFEAFIADAGTQLRKNASLNEEG